MKILYIDTSSSFLYSAIVDDHNLLCEVKKEFGSEMSINALPEIAEMFTKTELKPKDIDKIIVVDGPGSFTGVRIGVTIAKVYAWSLDLKISTITSLEAMATSNNDNCIKVPMIDARRGYVYSAIYDQDLNEILKPQHIKLEDLKNKLEQIEDYIIITDDEIPSIEKKVDYTPDILKIVEKYKDKKTINPHAINPDYLKLTEAEEKMG